jgi:hypothetical protein
MKMSTRYTTRIDVAALVSMIVAALILLALGANTATAQTKLGNRIKGAVSGAAAGAVTGGVSGDAARTGSVTFDERVLEITAERLDQFMVGLEAETEMAAKVHAQDLDAIDRADAAADAGYQREMAAYQASKDKHDQCTGTIGKDLESQMASSRPTEQDRAKLEAVAARVKAAKDAGNMTEVRRLADSIAAATNPGAQRMVAQSDAAVTRINTECGTEPVRPIRSARQQALTWNDVVSAGQKASRMSVEQYQIFRERVAPYVLSQGKSSTMMYTASELAAMNSKADALGKFGHVFKEY